MACVRPCPPRPNVVAWTTVGVLTQLALMHDYVVTMMLYVLYLLYAIAAIVAIYASLQIYIKMNTREEGITREIMMVVGACLFIIGASIVFPAFFGYRV